MTDNLITQLKSEISSALDLEANQIDLYNTLQARINPNAWIYSAPEIEKAQAFAADRMRKLNVAFSALDELQRNGYPNRPPWSVTIDVLREMDASIALIRGVIAGFEEIPAATFELVDAQSTES